MNPARAKITRREEAHMLEKGRDIDEEEEENLPAPPDGGYGWVVVFASFMCNMVVDGISYCFGIFLPVLIAQYGESKSKTAWVGSILTGATMCAGPIVSILVNKFGCRVTCILGSLISTAAFSLSVLCPSIETLMFVYGFVGGIGFGLIYLPAVVAVGYYFESKRSLATGIAVCGSGVGTFAFAPVVSILVEKYGWKTTNLVLAGVILCCVVYGALMRPLEYSTPEGKDVQPQVVLKSNGTDLKHSAHEESAFTSKVSISSRRSHVVQPMARKDIFYTGSVVNLKEFQSQKSLDQYRHSIHNISHKPKKPQKSCLPEVLKSTLGQLVDISLIKDPVFMTIGISNLVGMASLYVPFVYLVDMATADGIDSSRASFLISAIGITNTIARIICGYVADFPQINALLVNNLCLTLAAVTVGLTPFCNSYAGYMAVAVAFGLAIAGYISLTSIILVDLLGLDKLTNAFGLLILFRGIAALVGTPIAGALRDATQTYTIPFFVAGGLFAISAILSFAVPFIRKKTDKDTNANTVHDEAMVPMNKKSDS